MFMLKFKYVTLFLFSLFLNINATPIVRPFNFDNWNFDQEVEEAYDSSYEIVDGVLINVNDSSKNMKAKKILKKIEDLERYYNCLVNIIRDEIFLQVENEFLKDYGQYFDDDVFTETDNRFKQLIEIPMEEKFGSYRYRLMSFASKSWIKNPDYTKLFIRLQLKEICFIENYLSQKFGIKFDDLSGQKLNDQKSTRQKPSSVMDSDAEGSGNPRPSRSRRSNPRPSSVMDSDAEGSGNLRPSRSRRSNPRPSSVMDSDAEGSGNPRLSRQESNEMMRANGQDPSPKSKKLQPSGIKQGHIRPSSTRPSLRRPGRDIRQKFIRPIVTPIGDKPGDFVFREKKDEN
ncbi:hypothetical protein bmLB2001_001168 (plasmid) [Borrelia miyamotoi]|nr:hypothetical protein AXH25_04370 [Borrelia miyamotoi]QTL84091.1 hypothetical protein bmLB2001_001168 [Borrelia miyamotoi]